MISACEAQKVQKYENKDQWEAKYKLSATKDGHAIELECLQ